VENGTVKMRGNKITILSIQNVYKYNLLHQITAVGIDDQIARFFQFSKHEHEVDFQHVETQFSK
jgi:hypothetical protein